MTSSQASTTDLSYSLFGYQTPQKKYEYVYQKLLKLDNPSLS